MSPNIYKSLSLFNQKCFTIRKLILLRGIDYYYKEINSEIFKNSIIYYLTKYHKKYWIDKANKDFIFDSINILGILESSAFMEYNFVILDFCDPEYILGAIKTGRILEIELVKALSILVQDDINCFCSLDQKISIGKKLLESSFWVPREQSEFESLEEYMNHNDKFCLFDGKTIEEYANKLVNL